MNFVCTCGHPSDKHVNSIGACLACLCKKVELPAAEPEPAVADWRNFFRPWTSGQIKNLVERLLAKPCPDCGATTEKEVTRDLDIVCSKRCGWRAPIDTGPFSLGRRVD